jgi:hypothetical protein
MSCKSKEFSRVMEIIMNKIVNGLICVGMLSLGGAGALITLAPAAIATPIQYQTQRIEFAPGANSANVYNLNNATPTRYVLRANAGQEMKVELNSPSPLPYLVITGADGTSLLPANQDLSIWQGRLPSSQDYYVQVIRPQQAERADYNLKVTIESEKLPQPQGQRIEFAPGATSAIVSGSVAPHMTRTYLLKADAGQLMTINVNSPGNPDVLTVYGKDGTVLINGSMAGDHSWYGRLPLTEDYNVQVTNTTQYPTNYSMNVAIR